MTGIHVSQQMAIAPRLALRPSQTLVAATTLLALPSDRPIAVCVLAASLAKAFGAPLAALAAPAELVERFQAKSATRFPMQTLALAPALDAVALRDLMLQRGVRTVLHRPAPGGRPRLSFLITARHRFAEIDHAVDVLAAATAWRARRLGGWR